MSVRIVALSNRNPGAHWTSADGLARADVYRTHVADERGAVGWSYYLAAPGLPDVNGDRVGFGYTFAAPRELIYTPGAPTPGEVLETLASFLGAWQESIDYGERTGRPGECADLFPRACMPFLAYVDELTLDAEVYV